jgi:hypothetical protein
VSLSGDGSRVAIGAPGYLGGADGGLVRVYAFSGGEWGQVGADIIGEATDSPDSF